MVMMRGSQRHLAREGFRVVIYGRSRYSVFALLVQFLWKRGVEVLTASALSAQSRPAITGKQLSILGALV